MKQCTACKLFDLPDDSRFCPKCGGVVGMPKRKGKGSFGKGKKLIGVAVGAVAAVFVVAMVAIASPLGQAVPSDRVEQDVLVSNIVKNGVVPNDYVNESAYELVGFRVEDQVETTEYFFDEPVDVCTVSFSGTIRNDSFETEFAGSTVYIKDGDAWTGFSGPGIESSTSRPLKGVDYLSAVESDDFTVSHFESTFEESDGSFTSVASEQAKYEFWFADDMVKNTQTFTFDNEQGWMPKGDVEASEMATVWKLEGRSFALDCVESGFFGPSGSVTSTITFLGCESESLAADYELDFVNSDDDSSLFIYKDYAVNGRLLGVPKKEFGKDSFTVELNDAEHQITFSCSSVKGATVAGSGTVNAFSVNIITNAPYVVRAEDGSTYDTFEIDYVTFAEVV